MQPTMGLRMCQTPVSEDNGVLQHLQEACASSGLLMMVRLHTGIGRVRYALKRPASTGAGCHQEVAGITVKSSSLYMVIQSKYACYERHLKEPGLT